jgi:uncharacterized membrane protein
MTSTTAANASLLALLASFLFGLALVLTQFGLRYASPLHGALVSIPTATILLWLATPFLLDHQNATLTSVAIFAAVGCFFPATVTLLTFEANRQMGPSVSAALANLTPLFAAVASMLVLHEALYPLQALGIAGIILGGVILSVDRQWLGKSWSYGAMAFPIGAAAIRGLLRGCATRSRRRKWLASRSSRPPARLRRRLRRAALHSLRERRLVGLAGLEPTTRPL